MLPTAESPSPSPSEISSEEVDQAVENLVDNLSDSNFWLNDVLPVAIRVGVVLVLAFLLRWVLIRAVDKLVERRVSKQLAEADGTASTPAEAIIAAKRSAQRAETLGSLFRNIITITVYTLAGLLVMAELGFNLAPLIAGAGILGVALGFGAQSLVADFISGIFILMEDQYGVGDVVDVGDATGTVEEVQLRVTKIRAIDGVLWFVRNGEIMRVGNMSQDWSRTVLDVAVAYGADVKKAKEIMREIGEALDVDPEYGDKVLEAPEVWGVEDLGADAVVIRMVVKTKPGEQWAASRVMRERIKAAFDAAGIEIPFSQRTVWIRHDEKVVEHPALADKDAHTVVESVERDDVVNDKPQPFTDNPSGFEDDQEGDFAGEGDGDGDGGGEPR
jgi:small-conductance mechanosensitive channel